MSLYDILACPTCKVHLERFQSSLNCPQCGMKYPIVNGVPAIFPDGSVPEIDHEAELAVRDEYMPWVNRVILQSLLDDQIVLDVGSGNMALDDPCIIRMDVKLSPHVDLVADIHALPFLPASIDYIFSLAVFEHLHNPFQAAQSVYETLKDGGYIYHECNFVYAYHGYPHHYFNASLQGMEQIFSQFTHLRKGVATYQMPSFALDTLIRTYLNKSHANEFPHGKPFVESLRKIVEQDLMQYDIYFSEEEALNIAAGTYLSGFKQTQPEATVVPAVIRDLWKREKTLQDKFPDVNNLTKMENILVWAKKTGRWEYPEIAEYLDNLPPFNKRGPAAPWDRTKIHSYDLLDPAFGAIGFDPKNSMAVNAQVALQRSAVPTQNNSRNSSLLDRGLATLRTQGLKTFLRKSSVYLKKKVLG